MIRSVLVDGDSDTYILMDCNGASYLACGYGLNEILRFDQDDEVLRSG